MNTEHGAIGLFLRKLCHPFFERDQAIRNARTVRIEVKQRYLREYPSIHGPPTGRDQEYSGRPRYTFGETATKMAEKALRAYGLKTVKICEPHDLKLRIQITGTCIPQFYSRRNGTKVPVYSGARVTGSISLCPGEDLSPYQRGFSGIESPPQFVPNPDGTYGKPVYAPFKRAFEISDFERKLYKVLDRYFDKQ